MITPNRNQDTMLTSDKVRALLNRQHNMTLLNFRENGKYINQLVRDNRAILWWQWKPAQIVTLAPRGLPIYKGNITIIPALTTAPTQAQGGWLILADSLSDSVPTNNHRWQLLIWQTPWMWASLPTTLGWHRCWLVFDDLLLASLRRHNCYRKPLQH